MGNVSSLGTARNQAMVSAEKPRASKGVSRGGVRQESLGSYTGFKEATQPETLSLNPRLFSQLC